MDLKALKTRILGTRYLNFKSSDFNNTSYKDVVQSIIQEYYFTTYNPKKTFDPRSLPSGFDPGSFISGIKELKSSYRAKYLELFNYTAGGQFGPGEIVSYFLTKNGTLSGRAASGDLTVGSDNIEIKAAQSQKINGRDSAYDIRTGGTAINIHTFYNDLSKIAKQHNIPISRDIQKSTMDKLRNADPIEFKKIEDGYKEQVFNNYFNKYGLIVFDNSTSNKGDVLLALSKGQLSKDRISLYRFTQNAFTCNIEL